MKKLQKEQIRHFYSLLHLTKYLLPHRPLSFKTPTCMTAHFFGLILKYFFLLKRLHFFFKSAITIQ